MKAKQTTALHATAKQQMTNEDNLQKPVNRQLKIYRKCFLRPSYKMIMLPEIRLSDKWLHDIGFNYGQIVTVQHQKNTIIITLNEDIAKGC